MGTTELLIPTQTKIIICRTEFCQKCFDAGRPKHHDKAVVYGSSSGGYKLIDVSCRGFGERGFTPHIIQFDKVNRSNQNRDRVVYFSTCGICEIKLILSDEERKVNLVRIEPKEMSVKEWNSFLSFKDPQYQVVGRYV